MEFFNKKEEVLNIELTAHGKQLLSEGKLKPVYYAFFDDDVLYDRQWSGASEEPQNDIIGRIKETPKIKTQSIFESPEKKKNLLIKDRRISKKKYDSLLKNIYTEHFNFDSIPIGTSEIGNQLAPSLDFFVHYGTIDSIQTTLNDQDSTVYVNSLQKIPQINATITYYTSVAKMDFSPGQANQSNASDQLELEPEDFVFSDNSRIVTTKDAFILELSEENVYNMKDNFDIEVFKIEEVTDSSGTTKEALIQLYHRDFEGQRGYQIKNNVLLERGDPGFEELSFDALREIYNDPSCADYFLSIQVDEEIPAEVMCKINPRDQIKGSFLSKVYDCTNLQPNPSKVNIYGDDDFDGCF